MTIDLAAAIAGHHQFFCNTQTVTLSNAAETSTDSVEGVSSFVLNKKQAAALAGLISVEDEVRGFSFPTEKISSGYEPSNGMKFTDAAGQVWRIITTEMKTLGTRYLVTAVKTRAAYIAEPEFNAVPGAQSATEEVSHNLPAVTIVYDGSSLLTLSISSADMIFTVSHPGAEVITGNGTSDVTITGTKSQIEACVALNAWLLAPLPDSAGSKSFSLGIKRSDQEEDADTETVAVTVTVAEPSFATVPDEQVIEEGSDANAFPAIGLSWAGNSATDLQLTLTTNAALEITVLSAPGAVITGNASNSVTIVGTKAEIEACVTSLQWGADPVGANGSYAISLGIRRDGEGADADTDSIPVTVVPA